MARTADPETTIRRKEQILQATMQCVIKKGFHAASMKDICKQAGISAGGLYRYFSSKDEIILAMADEERLENQKIIDLLEKTDHFLPILTKIIALFFENFNNPDYGRLSIELMAEAGRNQEFLKIFQENEQLLKHAFITALNKAQERGEINDRFSPSQQASFIMAILDGFSARILLDPKCRPQSEITLVSDNLKGWLKPIA